MSNTDQAPEPTMDEILASIRRIISDEPTENKEAQTDAGRDSVAGDIARALSYDEPEEPSINGMDDDILELTEVVSRERADAPPSSGDGNFVPPPPPVMGDLHAASEEAEADMAFQNTFGSTNDHPGFSNQQDDQDIFSAPPSNQMPPLGSLASSPEQAPPSPESQFPPVSFEADITEQGHMGQDESSSPLIDSALFADSDGGPQASSSISNDSPVDFDSVDPPNIPGAIQHSSDDLENITSQLTDQLAQEMEQLSGREDLGGDDDPWSAEDVPEDDNLEAKLVEGNQLGAPELPETPDVLADDDSVTFGELSPEETIESTLEKAIHADDPEQGWLDENDLKVETDAEGVDEASFDEGGEDKVAGHGDQEVVSDMELSEVPKADELEEELSSAVASVKETVANEIVSEAKKVAAEPNVSEVVPSQPLGGGSMPSPLEESIKDMLKPMLREWLDDNMPRLLEGAMKEERESGDKKK